MNAVTPSKNFTVPNLDPHPFSLVGRLQPYQIEMITSPSEATIHAINKHVGDTVKPNETLLTLDDEAGKNDLINLITSLIDAEKNYQTAQHEYALNQELFQCGSESKNSLLEYENKLKAANITAIKTRQQLKQTLQHYKLSWETIEQLIKSPPQAFEKFIEKPLYKHIVSPSHGIVESTDKPLALGQHVKSGDNLYKVSNVSSYKITIDVPDKLRKHLQTGQPLLVKDYHNANHYFSGYVTQIKLIQENDLERFQMIITLHPDHAPQLSIGMPIEILISKSTLPITIPAHYLIEKNHQYWVKKWSNHAFKLHAVNVDQVSDNQAKLSSGLLPGDRIYHDKTA